MKKTLAGLKARVQKAAPRAVAMAMIFGVSLAHAGAGAGPIKPIVTAVDILVATVTAICVGVMTVAWGTAGYKMAFQGVSFRDVSSGLIGGAVAGAAGAIAATFIG